MRADYAAQLQGSAEFGRKSFLLAFDVASGADIDNTFRNVGTVVTDQMSPHSPFVDLVIRPQDDSAIAAFFTQATPFYEIGWTARFLPS